jgi:pimeloyl-ACP methyl ester carboxylesterase
MEFEYLRGGRVGGRKILFLHGYADSCKMFADLHNKLDGKYDMYSLSLPMVMDKSKTYNLEDLAKYVMVFVDKMNIQKYEIVGFSMGGMVATSVAHQDPRVSKLTLLNSSPDLVLSPFHKKIINKAKPIIMSRPLLFFYSRVVTCNRFRKYIGMFMLPSESKDRIRANYCSIYRTLINVAQVSLEFQFENISIPKQVVLFQDDEVLDCNRYYEYLKTLPCKLTVVSEGGHASKDIYWDQIARMLLT